AGGAGRAAPPPGGPAGGEEPRVLAGPARRAPRAGEPARSGVLLSMTGYGEASYQSDALHLAVELRSVNNRYLKVTLRAGEPYNLLEPEFEKVIRRTLKRGTIQVHLQFQRQYAPQDFAINAV